MAFGNFPDKINSNLHPKLPEVAFLENSIYIKTKQNKNSVSMQSRVKLKSCKIF